MGVAECIPPFGILLPVGGRRAAAGFTVVLLPAFGAGSMLRFPIPLFDDIA